MTYRVLITHAAQQDIRETVCWWRDNRSAEQAERWLDLLTPALDTLTHFPERCPRAPETDLLPTGLRQLYFGVRRQATHRIVFTIDGDTVVILRVRHVARQSLARDEMT